MNSALTAVGQVSDIACADHYSMTIITGNWFFGAALWILKIK